MSPSYFRSTALCAAAFLTLATSSLAAELVGTLAPEAVLAAARSAFQSNRLNLSIRHDAHRSDWFPHSSSFTSENPGEPSYQPIAGATGKVGARLRLADLHRAGKVMPGDIVLLSYTSQGEPRRKALVYAGEEDFVDEGLQSLFFYPFLTRLEYNIMPPRRHREQVKSRLNKLTKAGGPLAQLSEYTLKQYRFAPTDEKRSAQWLTGHVLRKSTQMPLYWRVSHLRGASYQVYRAASAHEPSRFPFLDDVIAHSRKRVLEHLREEYPYTKVTDLTDPGYLHGQCEVRANVVADAIADMAREKGEKVVVFKVFTVARAWDKPGIRPQRDGRDVVAPDFDTRGSRMIEWAFHVAAAFEYRGNKYVLDFGFADGLMSVAEWAESQRDVIGNDRKVPVPIEAKVDQFRPESDGRVPPR